MNNGKASSLIRKLKLRTMHSEKENIVSRNVPASWPYAPGSETGWKSTASSKNSIFMPKPWLMTFEGLTKKDCSGRDTCNRRKSSEGSSYPFREMTRLESSAFSPWLCPWRSFKTQWNINALPLPFISILTGFSETVKAEDFTIRIPIPEAYFIHKLIVACRRRTVEKRQKDLEDCKKL